MVDISYIYIYIYIMIKYVCIYIYIYIYLFVYLFIHLVNIVNHDRTFFSQNSVPPQVVALSNTASRCLTTTFATTTLTSSGTSAVVGKRSFQGFGGLTKGAGAYLFAISYLIYIYIYIHICIYTVYIIIYIHMIILYNTYIYTYI